MVSAPLAPLCAVCPAKGLPELWAPVQGLARPHLVTVPYQVSTHGRVRRADTLALLATPVHDTGYLVVTLGKHNRMQLVHRLVAWTFLGPPPRPRDEVDHLDFDRANDYVGNLRWLPKVHNAWRWKRAEREAEKHGVDPDEVMEAMAASAGW